MCFFLFLCSPCLIQNFQVSYLRIRKCTFCDPESLIWPRFSISTVTYCKFCLPCPLTPYLAQLFHICLLTVKSVCGGPWQYGLGARYEQGRTPRLHVALELYTPLPELHTIFLDLCDNSTTSDVSYDLTMKYGPTQTLRLNVHLQVGVRRTLLRFEYLGVVLR